MSSDPSPSRPRPFRSLAFRLNAWYVIVFVGSLAALVGFAVPAVRDAFDRTDTVVLERRVDRHVAVLATGLPAYQAAVESSARLGDDTTPVRVRDAGGRTLYEHGDVSAARWSAERIDGRLRLELGAPDQPWTEVADRLRPGAIALIGGALMLAVIGGFALTRRGLRPVRELAATALQVSRSGDLSARVPERGTGDELDRLSTAFNRMLARNQALVAGMRDALDNVAHDLRTPLTRLRGTAEVALTSEDPAAARDALGVCIEESDHVLVMLRALMDISEAEVGLMRLERRPVEIGRLAREVTELYEQVAEDAGVQLAVTGAPAAQASAIDADPVRMRQALANLVDNAIKYTPPGGAVTIELARQPDRAVIAVRDTGEGIPEAALPRIFDRLYRAEPSRHKPGLGLGLSLVKAIVAAHGGEVTVASQPGAGSTFTLALPLAAATP